MLTADNALWCLLALLVLLAAWGVIAYLGRERPIDWTAAATDLNDTDAAYAEARAMETSRGSTTWTS